MASCEANCSDVCSAPCTTTFSKDHCKYSIAECSRLSRCRCSCAIARPCHCPAVRCCAWLRRCNQTQGRTGAGHAPQLRLVGAAQLRGEVLRPVVVCWRAAAVRPGARVRALHTRLVVADCACTVTCAARPRAFPLNSEGRMHACVHLDRQAKVANAHSSESLRKLDTAS